MHKLYKKKKKICSYGKFHIASNNLDLVFFLQIMCSPQGVSHLMAANKKTHTKIFNGRSCMRESENKKLTLQQNRHILPYVLRYGTSVFIWGIFIFFYSIHATQKDR